MPGAADHGDPLVAVFDRLAQHLPHVRLADHVAPAGFGRPARAGCPMASARAPKTAGPGTCSTTSSHQRSGSSYPAAAASSPTGSTRDPRTPALAPSRAGGRPAGRRTGPESPRRGRTASPATPARTPRTARTPPGPVRRPRTRAAPPADHLRIRRQLHQRVRLRWPLDQHHVRLLRGQRRPDRPRRPRPVMPHSVQLNHGHFPNDRCRLLPAGSRCCSRCTHHPATSRQAR